MIAALLQSGSLNLSGNDVHSFAQFSAARMLNCTVRES